MRRSAAALTREHNDATRLLDELAGQADQLVTRARALPLPPGGRAWVRVADSIDANAWLIVWRPGSATGRHDHGRSHGAIRVLRGSLIERYWPEENDGAGRIRLVRRGATMEVPRGRGHDVGNAGPGLAVSLHVYAPRLARMNFYPDGVALAG